MKREEYLQRLAAALGKLSATEREEILADYQAYFADAVADGRSEEDICKGLGEPERLARELTAERKLAQWEAEKTPANMKQALGALADLGVINVLLAFPYLWLLTTVASLWLAAMAVLLAGVIFSGGWLSHSLTGWPDVNGWIVNDSGVGPWLIARSDDSKPPHLEVRGEHGEWVSIRPGAGGESVHIEAGDGEERFQLERDASGNISKLRVQGRDGEVVLDSLPAVGKGSVLAVGLVMLLLGGLGSWAGWKALKWLWQGAGRWLRWQQKVLAREGVVLP